MALEAAIATGERVPPRAAFHKFAADVNRTLDLLAAALRGIEPGSRELPDLREDHHGLVHSGKAAGLYGLVNVETDRITNALNTLAGEVLEWTSSEFSSTGR